MKINLKTILIIAAFGILPNAYFKIKGILEGANVYPQRGWDLLYQIGEDLFDSSIVTLSLAISVFILLNWLQKRVPWNKGIGKRLLIEISLSTFVALTVMFFVTSFLFLIRDETNSYQQYIIKNLASAFTVNLLLVSIYEGIYFFKEWKQSVVQKEKFQQEALTAELDRLKSQVNPHFLFNSLNTLSSLIDVDANRSKEFVDHLSDVYRYVLQYKDEKVVSLQTEMDFISHFIELLKIRHGEALEFRTDLSPSGMERKLPPLTLQLLVENAIKHNIASRKKPLFIDIYTEGNYFVVQNNLQKKKQGNSTGTGLQNIKDRYRFLTEEEMEIIEKKDSYVVKVPLLAAE